MKCRKLETAVGRKWDHQRAWQLQHGDVHARDRNDPRAAQAKRNVGQNRADLLLAPSHHHSGTLAEKYQMEPEFATKLVIISTVLSLPTLFVWTMVLV